MNRKILLTLAALALAAGCDLTSKSEWSGPIDLCRSPGGACTENKECCSYGCDAGVCVAGTSPGDVCKTSNDCGYPAGSFTQMLCKSGQCQLPIPYCRDDADVCTLASQCCSHHCSATSGGACVPNRAPVVQLGDAVQVVPRNQPWTLVNTSYDPDTADLVTYGWTITPSGAWSLSSPTAKNPVFTPGSAIASYTVTLDATDNWGLTSTGTITLNVVNSPPGVTPAAPATSWDRNNGTLNVAMDVADANGDALTCTWSICRGAGTPCLTAPPPFTVALNASVTPSNHQAAFPTGRAGTEEGPWDVVLSCTDGLLTTMATTTVTLTNSPPAVAAPATRTFNVAYAPAATAEQTITASAVDPNGDSIVSWQWTVVDGPATPTLTNDTTAAVGFTATVPGVYTLRATACDAGANNPPYVSRPGACGYADVTATVHRYIRPLTTGGVADAAWRKSDDRLVAVGTSGGAANQLWLANPAVDPGTTADTAVALGAAPLVMSLSVDGMTALVGQATSRFQTVSLGATPAASTLFNGPFDPTGVVIYNANRGYAFNGSSVYDLNLAGTYSAASCTNCTLSGSKAVTDGTSLWVLTTGAPGSLARFSVNNGNGNLTSVLTGSVSSAATNLWRSSDPGYLFLPGANGILVASTFNAAGSLPAGATQADSSLTGTSLVGLAATGATATPFGSSFTAGTPIALPHWGSAGADRTVTARYAFVSADGTKANVVVQSSAPVEWGLYTCTLPCPLF